MANLRAIIWCDFVAVFNLNRERREERFCGAALCLASLQTALDLHTVLDLQAWDRLKLLVWLAVAIIGVYYFPNIGIVDIFAEYFIVVNGTGNEILRGCSFGVKGYQ